MVERGPCRVGGVGRTGREGRTDFESCGMPMTTLAGFGRRIGRQRSRRESAASAARWVFLDMGLDQAAQLSRNSPVFAVGDLAESFRSLALKAHAEGHEIRL